VLCSSFCLAMTKLWHSDIVFCMMTRDLQTTLKGNCMLNHHHKRWVFRKATFLTVSVTPLVPQVVVLGCLLGGPSILQSSLSLLPLAFKIVNRSNLLLPQCHCAGSELPLCFTDLLLLLSVYILTRSGKTVKNLNWIFESSYYEQ